MQIYNTIGNSKAANSDCKFSLHSVPVSKLRSAEKKVAGLSQWQTDITTKFRNFDKNYETQKSKLLEKLNSLESSADARSLVDEFFKAMEEDSNSIKKSQGYAILQSRQALAAAAVTGKAVDASYGNTTTTQIGGNVLKESPTKMIGGRHTIGKAITPYVASPQKSAKENPAGPINSSVDLNENSPFKLSLIHI